MQMFRQSTNQKSLPGFWVVVTSLDGINSWSIQTLLRGENYSKQLDEIQATYKSRLDRILHHAGEETEENIAPVLL